MVQSTESCDKLKDGCLLSVAYASWTDCSIPNQGWGAGAGALEPSIFPGAGAGAFLNISCGAGAGAAKYLSAPVLSIANFNNLLS